MSNAGTGMPLTEPLRRAMSEHGWFVANVVDASWVESAEWVPVILDAARSRPPDCGDHYIAGYNAALAAVRYEQACAAREAWQRRAIEAEARLAAAGLGSDIDITCGDIEGRWIEDHLATLGKP